MIPSPPFRIGDVVRLKSGSPAMTVTWVRSMGNVEVAYWRPPYRKLERVLFDAEALRLAAEDEPEWEPAPLTPEEAAEQEVVAADLTAIVAAMRTLDDPVRRFSDFHWDIDHAMRAAERALEEAHQALQGASDLLHTIADAGAG